MPFLRMLWCLSLGLTNALQFTGPKQINADDDDDVVANLGGFNGDSYKRGWRGHVCFDCDVCNVVTSW